MDDLSLNSLVMFDDSLNNLRHVTTNIASNIHPRLDAYKKSSTYFTNQEERRKKALLEQKKYILHYLQHTLNCQSYAYN